MAKMRRAEIFDPYHRRIDEIIDQRRHRGLPTVLVSLHSFTPIYAGIRVPGISARSITATRIWRRWS